MPSPPCARHAAVLATEACRSAAPAQLGACCMLLAHLANSQEHLAHLPERGFQALAKVRGGGCGRPVWIDASCLVGCGGLWC